MLCVIVHTCHLGEFPIIFGGNESSMPAVFDDELPDDELSHK